MVISSQMLRRKATETDRLVINPEGEPIDLEGLPDDPPVPGLLVRKVTEAVKQVDEGMVVHYMNRDALWAVEGLLLDGDVVSSLPDGIDSASSLIEAVTEAGYEWQVVLS